MVKTAQYTLALISAAAVIIGISIIIYAAVYMNSGHPPASGIIALLVALAITPLSGLCLLVALFGRFRYEGHRQTHYDLALGINLLYVITLAKIWFYKAVPEKAI